MSEVVESKPSPSGEIAKSHLRTIEAFSQLCKTAKRGDSSQQNSAWLHGLLDQHDRYSLWASNMGAGNSNYHLSLDHRLEDASFYKDQVSVSANPFKKDTDDGDMRKTLRLLKILRSTFGEMIHILGGSEPSNAWCWDSDDSTNSREENDEETSSLGLSSDSGSHEMEDPQTVLNELESLLETVKTAIDSLYRLPIRKPAPVDRLKENSKQGVEWSAQSDISFVKESFPELDGRVASSLGKMVTRRRQLLCYRESRPRYLEGKPMPTQALGIPEGPLFQTEDEQTKASSRLSGTGSVLRRSSRIAKLNSEPTHFALRLAHDRPKESIVSPDVDAESAVSDQASDRTQKSSSKIPSRPEDERGESLTKFECNYCGLIVSIPTDKDWKKHVLKDLQPYVCTFAECELSEHLFESRDSWFNHETERHRVEFFCNTTGHCAYETPTGFLEHLTQAHGTIGEMTSGVAELFRRPSKHLTSCCNFCGQMTRQLKAHVSNHLQHIALFAIPRAHYESHLNADGNLSKLAQKVGIHDSSHGNLKRNSLYSVGENFEAGEAAEASNTDPGKRQKFDHLENEHVNAPSPHPLHEPHLPPQVIEAVQDLRKTYENSFVEGFMDYSAIEKEIDEDVERGNLQIDTPPPARLQFTWVPRIRCLDCPSETYAVGPDLTTEIVQIHLKSRTHRDAVRKRIMKILTWLSPYDRREIRVSEGSCQWIFENDKVVSWMEMKTKNLWCFGEGDSWRSSLASAILSRTVGTIEVPDNANVPAAFLRLKHENYTPLSHLVGSLARQLIARYPVLVEQEGLLEDLIRESKTSATPPEAQQIVSLLSKLALSSSVKGVFLIIDGLDEIRSGKRSALLDCLRNVENISVLIVSRHFEGLEEMSRAFEILDVQAVENSVRNELETTFVKLLQLVLQKPDNERIWTLWAIGCIFLAQKPLPMTALRQPFSKGMYILRPPESLGHGKLVDERMVELFSAGLLVIQDKQICFAHESGWEILRSPVTKEIFPQFHAQMSTIMGVRKTLSELEEEPGELISGVDDGSSSGQSSRHLSSATSRGGGGRYWYCCRCEGGPMHTEMHMACADCCHPMCGGCSTK